MEEEFMDEIAYEILMDGKFWYEITKRVNLERCNKIAIDVLNYLIENYTDEPIANIMFALFGILHNIIRERTITYMERMVGKWEKDTYK
jgi:cobalamin biosynthesis protein CobD/CbiB